jgi:hypothetical protein
MGQERRCGLFPAMSGLPPNSRHAWDFDLLRPML